MGERCIEADRQGIKLVFCPLGSVEGPWHYEEVRLARIDLLALYKYFQFSEWQNSDASGNEEVHCTAPTEQQPVVDAVRPDQHVPAVGVQGDSLSVALDQTLIFFSPQERESDCVWNVV